MESVQSTKPQEAQSNARRIQALRSSVTELKKNTVPQAVLTLVLPALLLAPTLAPLPMLMHPWLVAGASVLSLSAAAALYLLMGKADAERSVRVLAFGILATLLLGGMAMPTLNAIIH